MPEWLKRTIDRLKATHAYESWQRFSAANGNLLAAGVGYFAFFSVFPAVALAFAIFGFFLQDRPDLLAAIADTLNQILPGMVKTPENPNGIISVEAPSSLTLTVTGLVSFVTLLLAGLGWVGALRTGIRGIFGFDKASGNAVTAKARDLLVLVTLGVAVVVSAILTSAAGGLASWVASRVGLAGNAAVVALAGAAVGFAVDTLIMVVLLRVLSGVPLPWPKVRDAALLGALALTVLKLLGAWLIGRATANPLLGAVALSVGLLVWLNLISRVVLLSAAWAAGRADLSGLEPEGVRLGPGQVARPSFVAPVAARSDTRLVPYGGTDPEVHTGGAGGPVPVPSGQHGTAAGVPSRAVDRASVAAGFVLGGFTVFVAGAARRLRRVAAR
ncbi:YihY/virulence factor BrkB family protein [Intrasporangium sp. YIM S08009]|uniref:YihY/virulence factor BrkB family protein n=1 Tax=Intrasporangium zincisolvens TaxID=3080018 RepID=UPI002B05E75B|nr:YihY/virulence factor BrkB family protein [Intrasporangium sp. YIM S08009]